MIRERKLWYHIIFVKKFYLSLTFFIYYYLKSSESFALKFKYCNRDAEKNNITPKLVFRPP